MVSRYQVGMKELAESIKTRIKNNWDMNIIVDGPRGNGKSTFMYKLFMHLGEFVPERDIVFSREELIERMKLKGGLIMQDEMINAAHNRDFYEKDQKMLIKMLNMYRDNYNIMAGAVPFFYDLDPQVRKFIRMRITIYERGKAIIQRARNSMFTNDPWETDANRKIEMNMQRSMKKGSKIRLNYTKLTTFAGNLTFGALSKKQEERYHKIKAAKRNKLMGDDAPEEISKDKKDIEIMAIRYEANEITNKEIEFYCNLNDKKYNSIKRMINMWIQDEKIRGRRPQITPLVS